METQVILWLAALAVVGGMLVMGLFLVGRSRLQWAQFITLWGLAGPVLVGILSAGGVYQFQQGQVTQAESKAEAAKGQLKTAQARAEQAEAQSDEATAVANELWQERAQVVKGLSELRENPSWSAPTINTKIDDMRRSLSASEGRLKGALQSIEGASDEGATSPTPRRPIPPNATDKGPP